MFQAHALPPGDDCFRLAMASSGIGMAIVGLDGTWREINPAIERMFGYPSSEMIGRPASQFTHPDDIERSRAQIDALVSGRIPVIDAPKRYLHRDGGIVWTHANVAAMRSPAGVPLYLVVQLRDISAQREAEALLRASAADGEAELEASNRQLQLFADAVSHDLRAPLRSIESFSGLLAERIDGAIDETSRDYLARVRSAASRMASLLAALSELSHVTRAELKPGPVDISLLADWVGAELQEAEPDRAAEVRVQPGLVGFGDERLLKLLLAQLVGNAWKFSGGCSQVRIGVDGEATEDGGLRFHVRDGGSGFDMRYAHKLFEPFQRLHGPDQGGGHGLGLAIAQRIVARHHGRIHAESVPDRGSVFHVELPAPPATQTTVSETPG